MKEHKARVLDIVLIVKTFWGEVRGFGGEASPPPPHPPVDETLYTGGCALWPIPIHILEVVLQLNMITLHAIASRTS